MRDGETPNWLFAIQHPVRSLHVIKRQIAVSIEHDQPPKTSNQEDFPDLSLEDASFHLGYARPIRSSDWPDCVREKMERGEKVTPNGSRPRHSNI